MDSPLSESLTVVAELAESARRGDWTRAERLSLAVAHQPVPAGREEMERYLHALQDAVIVARASRADMMTSLLRLNAAARFSASPAE